MGTSDAVRDENTVYYISEKHPVVSMWKPLLMGGGTTLVRRLQIRYIESNGLDSGM